MIKDKVIEMIRELPDEPTIDDSMEELHFRVLVEHGIQQLDQGEGTAHKDDTSLPCLFLRTLYFALHSSLRPSRLRPALRDSATTRRAHATHTLRKRQRCESACAAGGAGAAALRFLSFEL